MQVPRGILGCPNNGTDVARTPTRLFYAVIAYTRFGCNAGYVRDCVFASAPSSLGALTGQLVVLKSRAIVKQVEAETVGEAASPCRFSAVDLSPDLVMQAVVALTGLHHGWGGVIGWNIAEARRVDQEVEHAMAREGALLYEYGTKREVRVLVWSRISRHLAYDKWEAISASIMTSWENGSSTPG